MKLILSLLSLGTTAGGVFSGILQQNLSQSEKPKIDILFDEIVNEMKRFSKENPMTEKSFKEIRFVLSDETVKENNGVYNANNTYLSSEYTFQTLTNIWMALLSSYIELWYDTTTNKLGDSENPYLKVKEAFTEENKIKKIKEVENSVEKEKTELENKFSKKPEVKEKIEIIFKKIKGFIFLVPLPKNYNLADSYENPYENYIKDLIKITKF